MDTNRREPKSATAARIYDYLIGGTHHFPADRAAGDAAVAQVPAIRPAARANRAFLRRAVRFAAQSGIRQFLDLGSGIPTEGNVHEIAQGVDPAARVVYVDMDPVAVSEGLEILAGNAHATSIRGDVLDTAAILAHPSVTELIDFTRPVAVVLCALLHFMTDDAEAAAVVATLRSACVPGSYLIISHGTSPDETVAEAARAEFAEGAKGVQSLYERQTTTPFRMRSPAEIEAFFDGYDLFDPGLVWVSQWRPAADDPDDFASAPSTSAILAAVGTLR